MITSTDERIPSSVCAIGCNGEAKVAVLNASSEPMIFRKREKVGDWEDICYEEPSMRDVSTDILCNVKEGLTSEERLQTLFDCLVHNRRDRELPPEMKQMITAHNVVFAVEDSELTQTSLVSHE